VFWGISTDKLGQTDLFFCVLPGFISRSVHARMQIPVCNGYDLFYPGQHPDRQTDAHILTAFDQLKKLSQLS